MEKAKKALAVLLTIAILCVLGGWTTPVNTYNKCSLIDYLETHEVESYAEFQEIIRSVSPESVDEKASNLVMDFSINIDYDNRIVYVTTIEESADPSANANKTASRSYYNDFYVKIFTISVTGNFRYSSGHCSTTSANGSFTKPFYSTWSSTPTISTGNISPSIAYARISGTATNGTNSTNYILTLTCNDSGQFGTTN